MTRLDNITIVGLGRVGASLGYCLQQQKVNVKFLVRDLQSATRVLNGINLISDLATIDSLESPLDTVLLAVNDAAIAPVCDQLVKYNLLTPHSYVVHFSGAQSSEILQNAKALGARVASLHPLQTLSDVSNAVKLLPGSHWFYEGDAGLVNFAQKLVHLLQGHFHSIKTEHKPLYHASAVMACNYLTVILDAALKCAEQAGLDSKGFLQALLPLMNGAIQSAVDQGTIRSLTGPVSRGDTATVKSHLEQMIELPAVKEVYCQLGRYAVDLAQQSEAINRDIAIELDELFKENLNDKT